MLRNYILIAWKVMGRNPFFTVISMFGISLTIGILLTVATLIHHALGSHYPDLARKRNLYTTLALLETVYDANSTSGWSGSLGLYMVTQYLKPMQTPETIAMVSQPQTVNAFVANQKFEFTVRKTCENFWKVHQFEFREGQPFLASHVQSRDKVAVISESTRNSYFSKNEQAVGHYIKADNVSYRVLGVVKDVPQYLQLYTYGDLYVPYTTAKSGLDNQNLIGDYFAIIQAKDRADFPKIREEFRSVIQRIPLPEKEGQSTLYAKAQTTVEMAASTFIRGDIKKGKTPIGRLILISIGITLLFMLLPALNLINLNASRIMERASEIGIRKAFGASSLTLVFQFIIENLVITLIGGGLGLLVAWGMLQLIEYTAIIRHADLYIDYQIYVVALLSCFALGLLSGVIPAWKMSKLHVVNALKGHIQ